MREVTFDARVLRLALDVGAFTIAFVRSGLSWRVHVDKLDGSKRLIGEGRSPRAALRDAERRVKEVRATVETMTAETFWSETADWNGSRGPRHLDSSSA